MHCCPFSAMKGGDKHKSQMMMRGRVAAQGFTVLAIFFGIFYKTKYSPLPPSFFGTDADTDTDTTGATGSNNTSEDISGSDRGAN